MVMVGAFKTDFSVSNHIEVKYEKGEN